MYGSLLVTKTWLVVFLPRTKLCQLWIGVEGKNKIKKYTELATKKTIVNKHDVRKFKTETVETQQKTQGFCHFPVKERDFD